MNIEDANTMNIKGANSNQTLRPFVLFTPTNPYLQ
jgi:hypothetical protein